MRELGLKADNRPDRMDKIHRIRKGLVKVL